MLSNLFYILIALLLLNVIVVFHELGHYLVGRLCGIGIVEFSVGFGPKLLGKKHKGIEYSLRALPLGGFCKFVGEDAEDSAPNAMNKASVWKRIATVAAGPLMNFLVAYIAGIVTLCLFTVAFATPCINSVEPNTPAALAGLQTGDIIVAAQGHSISFDEKGVEALRDLIPQCEELSITVKRGEEEQELLLKPETVTDEQTGKTVKRIGIVFGVEYKNYSFIEAIPGAFTYMTDTTRMLLDTLKNLFFKFEGAENMSGVVGTVAIVKDIVRENVKMIWTMLFMISLNLGIMNLLPFPALDGGRLIFLLVEAVRGKPVPPEKEGMVHTIGLLLLLVLAFVLTGHDIITYVFRR